MTWAMHELDRLFHPGSVAVVGAKARVGQPWLQWLTSFKGPVYSVQVNPEEAAQIEAMGFPNYRSLLDIPEPVDYVLVSVPRKIAPQILQDCITKGVEGVMFFTSGFAETGTEEGTRAQEQMTRMAREARIKVIGPNCVGVFNPAIGLRHWGDQYYGRSGPVGFISQSGTHANFFSTEGEAHGILVSKSVSFGNAIVLDCTDFLEYLGQDPETGIIGMYVEGIKDGRRFFRALREVCPRKPVVIWKGGQTGEGARAASSHTASLGTPAAVWDAMMRQSGAISVDSMDELLDTIKAYLQVGTPRGRRMGLVSMTGGQSVVITDTFVRAGLCVPQFTDATYAEFASYFDIVGGSYRNPLDMSSNSGSLDLIRRSLALVRDDENVDAVVYELNLGFFLGLPQFGPEYVEGVVRMLGEFRGTLEKPFFAVLTAAHREVEAVQTRRNLTRQGVATFPSFERAARAFSKVAGYHEFLRDVAEE